MAPTSLRLLVSIAISGVLVGYLGANIWDEWTGAPPSVPWAAPIVLAFVAAAFLIAALTLKPRIERRPGHRPLDPFQGGEDSRPSNCGIAGWRGRHRCVPGLRSVLAD